MSGESGPGAQSYAYLPRLGGPGVRLALAPPLLNWALGAKEGHLVLADVTAVRLHLQTAKFAGSSFEMELSAKDGTRFRIGSASRISLTGVRDQGPDYVAFVRAFHAARAGEGGPCLFSGGFPVWRFWLMAVMGAVTFAGLVAVLGFALMERQWSFVLFLAALSAFIVWPTAEMVWRNRPVTYRPDAIPAHLLPA